MHDFNNLTRSSGDSAAHKRVGYFVLALFMASVVAAVSMWILAAGDEQGVKESNVVGVLENLSSTPKEPQNILILGVDRRPEVNSEVEGTRADTIMLARVYPRSGDIELVSIPRDFMIEVSPGEEDKVNAAYSYGGVSETIGAIEHFADLDIDHYAVVDFDGFVEIVDSINGLMINVDESQAPPQWKVADGVQRLNGRKALLYARHRGTGGGDLDRIQRQQEVLAALRSKAFRWRSIKRLPKITQAVANNVETDMSLAEMASLAKAFSKKGRSGVMTSIQLKGTPETLENGSKVLIPNYTENEEILKDFRE